MVFMTINQNSPIPLYTQIAQQIEAMAKNNELKPGDPLPSIRLVASQLGIATNTVARAYRILESVGIIVSNGRKGSFIRSDYNPHSEENPFIKVIKELNQSGTSVNEIKKLFSSAIKITRSEGQNENYGF